MRRIRRIKVDKLFGVFDHDIPLNESGITLIHGPNGYGKTAILTLVDALARLDVDTCGKWPVEQVVIEVQEGSPIRWPISEELEMEARFREEPFDREIDGGERRLPPVRLIRTQRLVVDRSEALVAEWDFSLIDDRLVPTVTAIRDRLAERYREAQLAYGRKAEELDRTFPRRVLAARAGDGPSDEVLRREFRDLEAQRQRLIGLGLLKEENAPLGLPDGEIDEATRRLLQVYVHDTRIKLALFEQLALRAAAFRDIVGSRFAYKTMRLGEDGFEFFGPDDASFPPESLSSGEQHELVLLYELLFETEAGTLVMIDEPELSLHVSWQVEWLRDLEKIVELTGIDVLVATHSPQIINDRWDLTVELKGPGE